jgi:hypothetical protein
MKTRFLAISLGALIGLSPLVAVAQSEGSAEPMQVAQASTSAAPTTSRGSHRRHVRNQRNRSRERARASAEHKRTMREAPAGNN